MISTSSETALLGKWRLLDQTERGQIPKVGFRLVTHSQSFLFRHDEHSRGTVSLKTHANKQVTYSQCSLSGVTVFSLLVSNIRWKNIGGDSLKRAEQLVIKMTKKNKKQKTKLLKQLLQVICRFGFANWSVLSFVCLFNTQKQMLRSMLKVFFEPERRN